jgi:hypothetical protein
MMPNNRWLRVFIMAVACLAPSMVWANGWERVEKCFITSFSSAVIGCVAGLVVALCRKARASGLFRWTIWGGVALTLGGTLMFEVVSLPTNPDFAGFAIMSAISALLVAGIGGAILAGLALAIRAIASKKSDPDKPQTPVSGGAEK